MAVCCHYGTKPVKVQCLRMAKTGDTIAKIIVIKRESSALEYGAFFSIQIAQIDFENRFDGVAMDVDFLLHNENSFCPGGGFMRGKCLRAKDI
jgi:hypothetical protein